MNLNTYFYHNRTKGNCSKLGKGKVGICDFLNDFKKWKRKKGYSKICLDSRYQIERWESVQIGGREGKAEGKAEREGSGIQGSEGNFRKKRNVTNTIQKKFYIPNYILIGKYSKLG